MKPRANEPKARSTRPRGDHEPSLQWRAQREELLHAAQRAIRRIGADVSMEDVAAEAGITRPILYRHFGDRRGMAEALRDSVLGSMLGLSSVTESERRRSMDARLSALYPQASDAAGLLGTLSGWMMGFASFVEANRELYRFLRREGVMDVKWDVPAGQYREPFAESVAGSLQTILKDADVSEETARLWGYALVGMISGGIEFWAVTHDRDRLEIERDLSRLASSALQGLTEPRRVPRPQRPREIAVGARRRVARKRTRSS
jgi:AcrR family transcriptional regulator